MSTDDPAGADPPVVGLRSDPAAADVQGPAAHSTTPHAADVPAEDPPADPTGPPWSVDVVADLHAGRYPADVAGPLRQRLAADPWAASVLAALDATVDELSLLPSPRMPERFALRLDAALAAEARATAAAAPGSVDRAVPPPRQALNESLSPSGRAGPQFAAGAAAPPLPGGRPAPSPPAVPPKVPPTLRAVPSPPPYPATPAPAAPQAFHGPTGSAPLPPLVLPPVRSLEAARAKRRRWIGGLAAAAAVIAIGSATVSSLQRSDSTPNAAAPGPSAGSSSTGANALELDPGRLGDALQQIEGKRPAGPLQDTATYNSCLAANTLDPSAVSGVTAVTFQGRAAAAIAVVVDAGHSRIVVVGPQCGIGGAADQLASQTVDR